MHCLSWAHIKIFWHFFCLLTQPPPIPHPCQHAISLPGRAKYCLKTFRKVVGFNPVVTLEIPMVKFLPIQREELILFSSYWTNRLICLLETFFPPYFFLYYLFLPIEYLLMLNIMVGATNVEIAKKHGPSSRDLQVFWGRCHLTSAVIEMRVEDRRGLVGGIWLCLEEAGKTSLDGDP